MVDRVLPSWMTCVGCAELKERCAAKDAEIAALRERAERAEAALREIAGLDYTRAATNMMGHHAVTLAKRILRGEE